jgi:septum formation protein
MKTEANFDFYLASQSPRRVQLLKNLRYKFLTLNINVDESLYATELVDTYVRRIALAKLSAGFQLRQDSSKPVMAADTSVVFEGKILGKPKDRKEAVSMLKSLSGNVHEVLTAVCVGLSEDDKHSSISKTSVYFDSITDKDINAYCDTGDAFDKAGAYGIQGLAGAWIKEIKGSFTGVMGLPVFEAVALLKKYRINLL